MSALWKMAILFIALGSAMVYYFSSDSHSSKTKHIVHNGRVSKSLDFSPLQVSGIDSVFYFLKVYADAWTKMKSQIDQLRATDEENKRLRYENATLKLKLETFLFHEHSKEAFDSTEKNASILNNETGSSIGRTPSSVGYKPPKTLHHSQLYTLAISYFKAHEDEKAAVILTSLARLDETSIYRTPQSFLLTGIAWYRIENYKLADHFFEEVLKSPPQADSLQYQAQARLWKALVAKKLKKELKAQYWLTELLDHHPHSQEAEWVNQKM